MSLFRSRHADGDRLDVAGASVRLKVNGRARRVSLRVDRVGREIIATAPSERRLAEAAAFAASRAEWIAAQLADLPEPATLKPGMTVSVFGEPCLLEAAPGRAKLAPGRLLAPDDAAFGLRVARLLKAEARRVLTERTAFHSTALGQPLPAIAITDTKGRWGSCKPAHRGRGAAIRYSWRLALAPMAVADYVAAHECAHLIEANHGPKFWALVRELVGDPAPHRAWLKREGARLHAFGR